MKSELVILCCRAEDSLGGFWSFSAVFLEDDLAWLRKGKSEGEK